MQNSFFKVSQKNKKKSIKCYLDYQSFILKPCSSLSGDFRKVNQTHCYVVKRCIYNTITASQSRKNHVGWNGERQNTLNSIRVMLLTDTTPRTEPCQTRSSLPSGRSGQRPSQSTVSAPSGCPASCRSGTGSCYRPGLCLRWRGSKNAYGTGWCRTWPSACPAGKTVCPPFPPAFRSTWAECGSFLRGLKQSLVFKHI